MWRPSDSGDRVLRVCAGISMAPTVLPGEVVRLSTGTDRIGSGDAVLFAGEGDYELMHRFVFKVPFVPYFVHRGDAPKARIGLARLDRLVGVAAIPRRRPSLREHAAGWGLIVRFAARSIRRRVVAPITVTSVDPEAGARSWKPPGAG